MLKEKISQLQSQESLILPRRITELKTLAASIHQNRTEKGTSNVIWICTHNSRRSQLAQIWMEKALEIYGIDQINSYSGGTEATAFNHRMVEALRKIGFTLEQLDQSTNPHYVSSPNEGRDNAPLYFSKVFSDGYNPQQDFVAVMVCSQADQECPFVANAAKRFSLPYTDPKEADDTPEESTVYAKKVDEIGREILYMVKVLSSL